jgi:hypothetical protein
LRKIFSGIKGRNERMPALGEDPACAIINPGRGPKERMAAVLEMRRD